MSKKPLIIIRATINSRKGPSIPCEMYFDLKTLGQFCLDTKSSIIHHAVGLKEPVIAETSGLSLDELARVIHNDTGLDLTITDIELKQTKGE